MNPRAGKVTAYAQTHCTEKKENTVSQSLQSFLENKLAGTDTNMSPLVTALYYLLDPIA